MPAPYLLDLSHTSHTRARTGIQRVARGLATALGPDGFAITHDPYAGRWRPLQNWERANLAATTPSPGRGTRWPWSAQLRGQSRRLLGKNTTLPPAKGLIVPEIFSPAVASELPGLFTSVTGPRIALFHDALALQFPELTPAKTVTRFPSYLVELLAFDGIAAVSDDSRDVLQEYWSWLGAQHPPPVQTIPLAIDPAPRLPDSNPRADADPVILSVGSLEGRKNHSALLDACETLWERGHRFSLHLIGMAHPQTGRVARERIRALQGSGRPLRYDGPVDDEALEAAYAECAFTVYPSLREGFGLPVLESVARGKPCICSEAGALGEAARDGGCLVLTQVEAPEIAEAMGRLLNEPATVVALAADARKRRFRSWKTYAKELKTWMQGLDRRDTPIGAA